MHCYNSNSSDSGYGEGFSTEKLRTEDFYTCLSFDLDFRLFNFGDYLSTVLIGGATIS